MEKYFDRSFSLVLTGILILQFCAGLWYINYPFVDGRVHYNWGPAFWLLQAEKINDVGLSATYWGTKDYPAHPQLIGPVVAIWTSVFGYSEASIRLLTLSLTILATLCLALALRRFMGNKRAIVFTLIFASLPLIYIYGKKLDQEALVLLFLSIHLLGLSYLTNSESEKKGYILSTIGSFGMAMSDWSGIVFGGVIAISSIFAWGWKENKSKILKFISLSLGASFLGLVTFLTQSYLQAGSLGIHKFFLNYYELWQYRSGATDDASWFTWISREFKFLSSNYSIPLTFVGIIGLWKALRGRVSIVDKNIKTLAIFMSAILFGQLFYITFLKQASFIHAYYQYFLSIPIAFGLVIILDLFEKNKDDKKGMSSWLIASLLLVVCTFCYSLYTYKNMLFKDSGGDKSDIELVTSLKKIPLEKEIIVAEMGQLGIFWYENPNIIYYAGRPLKGYLLEEGVPFAEYQLLPHSQAEAYAAQINAGGYGKNVSATTVSCSTNICLLHLEKKQ